MKQPYHINHINTWRDTHYNPLRGINLQRLASMLEEGERGAYAELQSLYRMIEKRDAVLRAGKQRRLAALQKLDWAIQTTPDNRIQQKFSRRDVEAQAEFLEQAYHQIDNLKEAVAFLGTAEFRGFAHLEKHFEEKKGKRACIHLEPVPQWHWARKSVNAPWEYNRTAKFGVNDGEPIDPAHFIIREVEDPINEIAAISFLRRSMSQKDWDGFVETYGIPPLFAEMPPNVPPDKENEYQELAEAVISDARGTLPSGARIHTIPDGARGVNPFREHIKYQDELVVLAITGGKLTMLAESGSGTLAGNAHADTFNEIARAEAERISEIFQRQLDRQLLADAFPGMPALAYFTLGARQTPDAARVIEDAERLSKMGFHFLPQTLSELTGYPIQVDSQEDQPKNQTNQKTRIDHPSIHNPIEKTPMKNTHRNHHNHQSAYAAQHAAIMPSRLSRAIAVDIAQPLIPPDDKPGLGARIREKIQTVILSSGLRVLHGLLKGIIRRITRT